MWNSSKFVPSIPIWMSFIFHRFNYSTNEGSYSICVPWVLATFTLFSNNFGFHKVFWGSVSSFPLSCFYPLTSFLSFLKGPVQMRWRFRFDLPLFVKIIFIEWSGFLPGYRGITAVVFITLKSTYYTSVESFAFSDMNAFIHNFGGV